MTVKKFIFVAFLLVLVPVTLLIGYRGYKSYNGYCFEQDRYLSDGEKIRSAIQFAMSVDATGENHIPYISVDEFVAENPDCCSLNRTSSTAYTPSLLDRLSGTSNGYVHIKFKSRSQGANVEITTKSIETEPAVTNCGRVWIGF